MYTLGQLSACRDEMCADIRELFELAQQGGVSYQLQKTYKTIYEEFYAGGANQNSGGGIWQRNVTITPLAITGTYSVVFNTPHPDGIEYHISYSGQEDNNRDNPKVTTIQGTKTANGFNLMVTGDDNGGGADFYDNNPWSFSVDAPCEILEEAQLVQVADVGPGPTLPNADGKVVSDNFQDQQFVPFNLQVRNTTNAPVDWEALVQGVPYASISGLAAGNYTLTTTDNGDGTYDHLFTGTSPLGPFANITITGSPVTPAGDGSGLSLYCQAA